MRSKRLFQQSPITEEINISPLIDIVFILLIFFIVTTVFVEETGIDVDKPQAASARNLEKNSVLIAITESGQVIFGGREVGITGVGAIVRRLNQQESMPVIIQADSNVPTHLLVRVIDEAKLAGAPAVSIATRN
jgi:biopolymer transport protein ExbD